MSIDHLQGLNKAQREAVESVNGPLLVIAGPGSGKTRVITHRIAYLIHTVGVSPSRILAVTFTNKAAHEMKDRLQRLVGTQANDLTVGTFHAFCASVLRRYGYKVGLDSAFSIFDSEDQLKIIKESMELNGIDPKQFPPRSILGAISKAKSLLLNPMEFEIAQTSYFERVVSKVYLSYEEMLGVNHAVDFDDLLFKTVVLFRNSPEVLRIYQERYIHLLIDEFQDTNVVQYSLAKLMADKYRKVCVVGDPDQSIYSWRNADIRNILSFKKDYSDATVVTLEVNYRSTGTILAAARNVISANNDRLEQDIRTVRESGCPIVVHEAFTEDEEAQFILKQMELLFRSKNIKPSQCAVMYRVNAQSRALEEACIRRGMPYRLIGGVRFYQRKEVKDIVAYLRLISNPEDQVSLSRIINIPPRGIGKRSFDKLLSLSQTEDIQLYAVLERIYAETMGNGATSHNFNKMALQSMLGFVELLRSLQLYKETLNVVDLIDRLLEGIGYQSYLRRDGDMWEERWENVMEIRGAAVEYQNYGPDEGLAALLEKFALVADIDSYDATVDAVTLITLHQAKGLEFPVVFIAGMEDGLLPHIRSMDSPEELEEERRLFYVGITRSMDQLFLTRAFRRRFRGSSGPTIPSRFLQDIPEDLIGSSYVKQWDTHLEVNLDQQEEDTVDVFKTGDRVRHDTFGEGLVISSIGHGRDSEVTVVFTGDTGIKRLLVIYAHLQKIQI